ncbi:MAG: NifB/NifX family molybdenum-iron cluster-binding protein [Halobacteriota archaeon]|nr:NifB/NifX family molybdenum-iron cluster-binding protein [Halobacteriota archaeon]
MKICVTATGKDLNAEVDPRFGRCQYFVIVDPDTMNFEAFPNKSIGDEHDAGVETSKRIIDEGVDVLITGNVGPNALSALSFMEIEVVTGAMGTVGYAIEMYKNGKLILIGDKTAI